MIWRRKHPPSRLSVGHDHPHVNRAEFIKSIENFRESLAFDRL